MLRRPRNVLALALVGMFALVVLHVLAFDWGPGRQADGNVLQGFRGLDRPAIRPLANAVADLASPKPFVVLAVVLVGLALLRGRPRTAVTVGLAMGLANLTSQLLKPLLAVDRPSDGPPGSGPDAASWPSGHATASMSLALGAVLVASSRWRPSVAAVGAAYSLAVCYAFLSLGWHFPSDVLGGYLVAATWMCLGVAVLVAAARRWPEAGPRTHGVGLRQALRPVALLAAIAAMLLLVALAARPESVIAYARDHTAFVVGATTIGTLGVGLVIGLLLALREPPAGPAG
jgi:membrane-associated phospholipid phosphatase